MRTATDLPLGSLLCLLALCPGCATGARSWGERALTSGWRTDTLSWTLRLDDNDLISVEHVESVFRQAGVLPTSVLSGGGAFVPWGFRFVGEAAYRAHEALTADPSWPEISLRLREGIFSVERRLLSSRPGIVASTVAAARAWLLEHHSPVAILLGDRQLTLLGAQPAQHLSRSEDEELVVAWLTVIERDYLGADGRRHTGYEMGVEMRTSDDQWGRVWYGQVLEIDGMWKARQSSGGSGPSRRK